MVQKGVEKPSESKLKGYISEGFSNPGTVYDNAVS